MRGSHWHATSFRPIGDARLQVCPVTHSPHSNPTFPVHPPLLSRFCVTITRPSEPATKSYLLQRTQWKRHCRGAAIKRENEGCSKGHHDISLSRSPMYEPKHLQWRTVSQTLTGYLLVLDKANDDRHVSRDKLVNAHMKKNMRDAFGCTTTNLVSVVSTSLVRPAQSTTLNTRIPSHVALSS